MEEGGQTLFAVDAIALAATTKKEGPVVSWSDWDFIQIRIAKCKISFDWWIAASSFFGGMLTIALGAFLATPSSDASASNASVFLGLSARMWYFGGIIGGFVGAIACAVARRSAGNVQAGRIDDVLEYMKQIAERYVRSSATSAVNPKSGDLLQSEERLATALPPSKTT